MEIKRRTEITIETHERTIIRVSTRHTINAFCATCRSAQKYFSVRRAAALLRLSELSVFRLAESGQVHWSENARGELFICADSISAAAGDIKREIDLRR